MGEQLRILLIDVDADDRTLAASVLLHELPQAAIIEVADALEFAQAFAGDGFALAVSAQDLGWALGSDLLRSVKRRHPGCATILFAPGGMGQDRGTDAVLGKSSAGFVELPRLAQRLLRRRAATEGEGAGMTLHGALLDRLPVGVFTLSGEGEIQGANRPFATLLGFDAARAVVGRPLPDLLVDRDARIDLRHRLERGESVDGIPLVMTGQGGAPGVRVVLSVWPAPLPPGEGGMEEDHASPPFQGLLLTAERETATTAGVHPDPRESEQLQVAAALFRELQDPLQLLAQYAHALAERYRDALDGDALGILERTEAITDRLQGMLRGMVGYTAARRERTHPLEEVSLSSVLAEVLVDLESEISASRAQVTAEQLPTVIGDRELLGSLFRALIDNSIKFRAGEPPVIRVFAEERANDWLLTVEDNGIGIPEEDAERVFELFERLHDPDAYPGAGIGLSLCRYVAARHGGDVWVRPAAPHGCAFLVTLSKHLQPGRNAPAGPAGVVPELGRAGAR